MLFVSLALTILTLVALWLTASNAKAERRIQNTSTTRPVDSAKTSVVLSYKAAQACLACLREVKVLREQRVLAETSRERTRLLAEIGTTKATLAVTKDALTERESELKRLYAEQARSKTAVTVVGVLLGVGVLALGVFVVLYVLK